MKWSAPSFTYHGILCGMAAFKRYCAFAFWKSALLAPAGDRKGQAVMEQLGRMATLAELPPKRVLAGYLRKAMQLNASGIKLERPRPPKRKPVVVPADLRRALARNRQARTTFASFSPSHRREYVEWITEAKQDETRERRLSQAVAWMAEGKARNWKYQKS